MIEKVIKALLMLFSLLNFAKNKSRNVNRSERHQRQEFEQEQRTRETEERHSDQPNDPDSNSSPDLNEKIMASVKNIYDHVFKWEGGLVFHQNEGQWTNMGVQWTTFQRLAEPLLGISRPTIEDLKGMSKDQAKKFIDHFWNLATYYNRIKNQDTANIFFTALWGSGQWGIKDLQKALGFKGSDVDGVVGPKTVAAANKANPEKLYTALENRYRRLAAADPQYQRYLKGWLNRLQELEPGKMASVGIIFVGISALILIALNRI